MTPQSLTYILYDPLQKVWWCLFYNIAYTTIYLPFFPVDKHKSCFQISTIINKIAIDVLETAIGEYIYSYPLDMYQNWIDGLN